jgi:hypothetical protein
LALAWALSACSGNTLGGQTVVDTADALVARPTGSQMASKGIAAANALGARIRQVQFAAGDDAWSIVRFAPSAKAAEAHLGRCEDGIELFAPDRNGDPNSTEAIVFFDADCSQPAVDDVRVYTSTGSTSETVAHTASFYAPHGSSAIAVATAHSTISNAAIGSYGLPSLKAGFADVSSGTLNVGGKSVLAASSEFVMMPGTRSSSSFCGDSAGYDPSGIASLDETFGAQGGILSGGSRHALGNAFVQWAATPTGTAYQAAIGSLSIGTGTQNVTCPITIPNFTLTGGTAIGTYSIPIGITFHRGKLWSVTVRNGMLPGGDTLNVRTNRSHRQGGRALIDGSIASGKTPVAGFVVNTFGNGTLTIVSTGAVYKIVDWVVVQ